MSDDLNHLLGTSITFTKLSTNDLAALYSLLTDPHEMARRYAAYEIRTRVDKRMGEVAEIGTGIIEEVADNFLENFRKRRR